MSESRYYAIRTRPSSEYFHSSRIWRGAIWKICSRSRGSREACAPTCARKLRVEKKYRPEVAGFWYGRHSCLPASGAATSHRKDGRVCPTGRTDTHRELTHDIGTTHVSEETLESKLDTPPRGT